jgi:N-acetylmuramoyl-L-alanine amidase
MHKSIQHPVSSIAIILFILLSSWAVASTPVDGSNSVESLTDNPAILLPPLHATAHYYGIDFQWDSAQGRMVLSKDGAEASLVLGNQHVLVNGDKLLALSEPPVILRGAVALPPQDIASILSDLMPSMDVSWDEAQAAIEVKRKGEGDGNFELKTIVIDPGHGGYDPGAVKSDAQEKKIVLDVALRLRKLIESRSNWEAVLTRDSDKFVSLRGRTNIANQYLPDSTLFISIHCNSDRSSSARGLETYLFNVEATDARAAALVKRENAGELSLEFILNHCYHVGNEPYSLEAAQKAQSALAGSLKLRNRGVKRGPFYVLAGTKMPAILIELGFVSNYSERKKLQSASFRQSSAEALFRAIEAFDKATGRSLVKADAR